HRHNAGFMVVDELARRARADAFREKFSGVWAKGRIAGEDCVLLKPMTYMNDSGRSVQPAAAFFKVEPKDVVVIHDELDVPLAEIRLKLAGGHAGHNDIRSIIQVLGTPDFGRVRFGISQPPAGFRGETADYVLSSFDSMERAELSGLVEKAAAAVERIAE